MDKELQEVKEELKQTKHVLGTLIGWLQQELGRDNAVKLIEDLNKKASE